MNDKEKWDSDYGKPQLKVLQAIRELRLNAEQKATAPRIAELLGRTTNQIGTLLTYFWDRGYVKRLPIRKRHKKLPEGEHYKPAHGCSFHYRLTKNGAYRLNYLTNFFLDLEKRDEAAKAAQAQSSIILPSDRLPSLTQPGDPGQPSTMTPGAAGKL